MSTETGSIRSRRSFLVRAGLMAVAGLILTTALYLVAQNPPTDNSYYPKCISYKFTSIHCPGCGTTRALHALLNLDLEQAFAYNAVMVTLLPLGLFVFIRKLWHSAWGTQPARLPGYVWVPRILAVVFVLFWILRNIPVYPLTLLAPHQLTP